MSPLRDPSAGPPTPPATPRERIDAARHVLIIAIAALAAASLFWDVPVAFSATAIGLLVIVAAYVPRRRAAERWTAELARAGIWPDTSMKLTVEAFPQAGFILDPAGTVRYANIRARRLFPATRPGDPFTLTFRSPDIGAALNEARLGRARSVEFHEPGETTNTYSVDAAARCSRRATGRLHARHLRRRLGAPCRRPHARRLRRQCQP